MQRTEGSRSGLRFHKPRPRPSDRQSNPATGVLFAPTSRSTHPDGAAKQSRIILAKSDARIEISCSDTGELASAEDLSLGLHGELTNHGLDGDPEPRNPTLRYLLGSVRPSMALGAQLAR